MRDSLSKQELALWPKHRLQAKHLLESQPFELVLSAVIVFNLALMVVETDITALHGKEGVPGWMSAINSCLLASFSVELGVRLYVFRWKFFRDPMSIIDACVVMLDIFTTVMENLMAGVGGLSILRILRLLRLSRATLIVEKVPELSMLARSLIGALQPIFWGSIILVFLLAAWGVLAVQFIHPLAEELTELGIFADMNCERCPRAYKTVWHASLTMIQQIIAGDSWGLVTLPIIEYYPAAASFFILMFVSLQVALMNVVLACVVDSAAQARSDDLSGDSVKKKLQALCDDLDDDQSGEISFDELKHGFTHNKEFKRRMGKMDIREGDVDVVWDILDNDKSGNIATSEFCDELAKLKKANPHTMLIMIRHYVTEIRDKINAQLKLMRKDLEDAEARELVLAEKMHADEQELAANVKSLMRTTSHANFDLDCDQAPSGGAQPRNVQVARGPKPSEEAEVLEMKMNAKSLIDSEFVEEQRRFMADMTESTKELQRKLDICMRPMAPSLEEPDQFAASWAGYDVRAAPIDNKAIQLPSTRPGLPVALFPCSSCSVDRSDSQSITANPPPPPMRPPPLLPAVGIAPGRPR